MKLNKFGSLGAGGSSPRSVTITGTYTEFRRADVFAVEIVDLMIVYNVHRQIRVSDERNVNRIVSMDALQNEHCVNWIVSKGTLQNKYKILNFYF